MKSLIKMIVILFFVFVVLSLSGCFLTITQNLKDGSTLLVSAFTSLEKDFAEMQKAAEPCIQSAEISDAKKYNKLASKFEEGFKAVGIAIRSEDEVIQLLKTKKEK